MKSNERNNHTKCKEKSMFLALYTYTSHSYYTAVKK